MNYLDLFEFIKQIRNRAIGKLFFFRKSSLVDENFDNARYGKEIY